VSDPLWGNVSLLLPFDGADGATTTTDESATGNPITFGGGAQIDTAQSKFGGSSALFNGGTSDYILAPSSALTLTGDYSIQFWIRLDDGIDSSHSGYVFTSYDDTNGDGADIRVQANFDTAAQAIRASIFVDIFDSSGSRATNLNTPTSENIATRLVPGQWQYVEITRSSGSVYVFIDGSLEASGPDFRTPSQSDPWLQIGGSNDAYGSISGHIDDLRITNGAARNTVNYTPPTAAHEIGGSTPSNINAVFPSVLGSLNVQLGYSESIRVAFPGLLRLARASVLNDFTGLITDPTETYIMRITGSPPVEIPISSWQATVQSAAQSFLQCVVPAAADYIDMISARQSTEQMVIYRKTVISGQVLEREMARASIGTIQIDAGPKRYAVTLRGYTTAFSDPVPSSVVTLTGIRSQSVTVGSAIRIRANIDWLLRPGQVATDGDVQFTVGYINYFVPTLGDAYMDVGSRG
jgi:hypothetical protein